MLFLGLNYGAFRNTETEFIAQNNEQIEFVLPDASAVFLNAGSEISYDEKDWSNHRNISLQGEAFFKVAKGSKFEVQTSKGTVSVLGTEFVVKARPNYFEVICYEGKVLVNYAGKSLTLTAGNGFNVFDSTQKSIQTKDLAPTWLQSKSSFTSIPFSEVVQEIERQYNIRVSLENIQEQDLFTGSFTHNNLETALQALTIPFNLSYTIDGNNVVLKSKQQ